MSGVSWGDGNDPCVTIVEAVADATDRSPTDLPPLQRSVDVDALVALATGDRSSSPRIEFDYADVVVIVDRNVVAVTEPEADHSR